MRLFEFVTSQLRQKPVRSGLMVVACVVLAVLFLSKSNAVDDAAGDQSLPIVTLTTAHEYAGGQSLSLIGSVRPLSEAKVTAERAGRVVSVNTALGEQVQAGEVLIVLEHASEQAAVLQAEGVYEAAVAAAAQSEVGVDQAKTALKNAKDTAVSTFRSAYNTVNGLVRNSIDPFFSDPDARTPGLRINGKGYTATLNAERVAYQDLLPAWQAKASSISTDSDLPAELDYAKQSVQRTVNLVDTFLTVFSKQDNHSRYSDSELQNFIASFTTLRSTLLATESAINGALTGLESATDGVQRAELAAAGGTASASDAQVKQALGTLRAAQANLAKTILRTPISGTVNSLAVRPGDFISTYQEIATVANNDAHEIVTYLSERDRDLLTVGDTLGIEGDGTAVVTEIAPAVDSSTGKIEVHLTTEESGLLSGDTVRLSKEVVATTTSSSVIKVPLSAVKFNESDGSVFTVKDDHLVSQPVTLGTVRRGAVEITEGLNSDEQFVLDARGLVAGEKVSVKE